jgi:hypothetical protein
MGVVLGYLWWPYLGFSFDDPWEISGVALKFRLYPLNDALRSFVLVMLPCAVLFWTCFLKPEWFKPVLDQTQKLSAPSRSRWWWIIFLFLFGGLVSLNVNTYHAFGKFDAYHEGESLGPAVSYLHGAKPYRDVLFFHGVVEDPLRSVMAFELFGKSIAAARAFQSLIKISAWMFLTWFLLLLFEFEMTYVFLTLSALAVIYVDLSFDLCVSLFMKDINPLSMFQAFVQWQTLFVPLHLVMIEPKEAVTFAFLVSSLLLFSVLTDKEAKKWSILARSFFFSLIPVAAAGYALDRGIYLLVVYAALFAGMVLFTLTPKLRGHFFAGSFLGLLAGLLLLGTILQWQWAAFIEAIQVIPAISEFSAKLPYPITQKPFIGILIVMAFNSFWIGVQLLRAMSSNGIVREGLKAFWQENFAEIALGLLSILLFTNATERSDWEHVCYSSVLIYILFAKIIVRQWLGPWLHQKNHLSAAFKVMMAVVVIIGLLCMVRFYREDVFERNFPLRTTDSAYVPDADQKVVAFLKTHLQPEDEFFTFTSDADWYYLLDKPSPTRFPYILVASSNFYQNEVVDSLTQKKVKLVLYRDPSWSYTIDGLSNEQRLPIIAKFLQQNYKPYAVVEGHEIWKLEK